MEPLSVILKRFLQSLPFLTTPFGHRRFHSELFHPYPDVRNDRETASGGVAASQIHEEQVASQEPALFATSSFAAPNRGDRLAFQIAVRRDARSYLRWMELHHSDRNRREPFW